MFSVDWPFASNKAGTDWVKSTNLSQHDKEKVLGATAKTLLKL